jgi:hypothetical protein
MSCAIALIAMAAPTDARAERTRFRSSHPIPDGREGSFCYIEVPHQHSYEPSEQQRKEFYELRGALEFIGDPMNYGYEGPVFTYAGAHPMAFEGGSQAGECLRGGIHDHVRPPASPDDYVERDGSLHFKRGDQLVGARRARPRRQARRPRARKARKARGYAAASAAPKLMKPRSPRSRRKVFRSWMDRRSGR